MTTLTNDDCINIATEARTIAVSAAQKFSVDTTAIESADITRNATIDIIQNAQAGIESRFEDGNVVCETAYEILGALKQIVYDLNHLLFGGHYSDEHRAKLRQSIADRSDVVRKWSAEGFSI